MHEKLWNCLSCIKRSALIIYREPLHLRAELLLGQRCDTKVDLYSLGAPLRDAVGCLLKQEQESIVGMIQLTGQERGVYVESLRLRVLTENKVALEGAHFLTKCKLTG